MNASIQLIASTALVLLHASSLSAEIWANTKGKEIEAEYVSIDRENDQPTSLNIEFKGKSSKIDWDQLSQKSKDQALLRAKSIAVGCDCKIEHPPFGEQRMWPFYKPTQYTKLDKYDLEIFATPSVSPWMIQNSKLLISQMISALKNPEDRAKFKGHENFLITDKDPSIEKAGGLPGHRNTGGGGYSLFDEVIVCAKAVGTLYPNAAPVYRAWNTPVHEFGHAIEVTLGLRKRSDELYSKNQKNYKPKVAREYFAWGVQHWFASTRGGKQFRDSMPQWEFDYYASIFSTDHTWLPKDEDGPKVNIQKWDDTKSLPPMTDADLEALQGNYVHSKEGSKSLSGKMSITKTDGDIQLSWKDHKGDKLAFFPDRAEWVLKTEKNTPPYSYRINEGKEIYLHFESWAGKHSKGSRIGLWHKNKFYTKKQSTASSTRS